MSKQDKARSRADLVARLGRMPTSTLANALDEVELYHNVFTGIHAVSPGARLAGPAVTVLEATGEHGSFPSADFRVGAMIDAAAPGDVIVVAADGVPYSTWGGMASLAATVKGLGGLVVDGGVRDLEEIIECGFCVFARHVVPTTGRTRLKVEDIDVPITVAGVRVEPGDIIVGDGTGAVCVPAGRAEDVAVLAERFAADDSQAAEEIRRGLPFSEAMRKFQKI